MFEHQNPLEGRYALSVAATHKTAHQVLNVAATVGFHGSGEAIHYTQLWSTVLASAVSRLASLLAIDFQLRGCRLLSDALLVDAKLAVSQTQREEN